MWSIDGPLHDWHWRIMTLTYQFSMVVSCRVHQPTSEFTLAVCYSMIQSDNGKMYSCNWIDSTSPSFATHLESAPEDKQVVDSGPSSTPRYSYWTVIVFDSPFCAWVSRGITTCNECSAHPMPTHLTSKDIGIRWRERHSLSPWYKMISESKVHKHYENDHVWLNQGLNESHTDAVGL